MSAGSSMRRGFVVTVGVLASLLLIRDAALAQVTPDQERRIVEALPTTPRVAPKRPRRVLIWNTPLMERSPHKGYTIPQAAFAFAEMGKRTGAFEGVVSDDLSLLLPDAIRRFDVILLNNSCGDWITPTPQAMERLRAHGDVASVEKLLRRSFLDFVAAGGGLVAYHYAIGANRHWPEYAELLGAGYWGHPWNEEVGVRVDEPDHPLVAAFGGQAFRVADEIYQFREPYSRERLRVILSLDTRATNMAVKWIHRTDGDFALAWVKPHGRGRVFYTALGHRTEIWWSRPILRFFLDAIQFAAGDLEASMEPSRPRAEPRRADETSPPSESEPRDP